MIYRMSPSLGIRGLYGEADYYLNISVFVVE